MFKTLFPKKRRGYRLALFLSLIALLTAACSSAAGSGGSGSSGSSGNSSGASGALSIVASPAGPFSNGWNPFSLSTSAYVQGATGLIYEPLMQYNLAKAGQIYPWLATSWSWADGGKQLILHTRTGVKWSDGKPFTAADVAFTFNLMKKFPALDGNGVSFTGASAPSPTEAIVNFAQPAYSQLFDVSQVLIVPQHIWTGIANPVTYTNDNPIGTGPYLTTSFTAQEFTLNSNPHYWQPGLPKIATLRFLAYASNPSAGLALGQEQVDWSTAYVPNYQTAFLDKNPQENHISVSPIGDWYLCPNLTQAPFNNTTVRQALSEAIDRNTIASEGEHGYYFASSSPTGLSLPRWQSSLAPQYANLKLKFDPSAAKSLLESAGFKAGSNGMLNQPNGAPFKLTILGPAPYTDFMTDAQLMASELQQAGISASVSGVSVSDWSNDSATGNYQLTFCGEFTTNDPYSIYNYMFNSALSAPVGKSAIGDFERWNNPQVDAALQAAAATNDPSQLLQAYTTIEGLMVQDVPVIPLFNGGAWALYTTNHAVGWPSASDPYEMNEVSSPWDEVVVLHLKPA
jgi:peptide/nickel transport system substrate-binding protein